MNTSDKKVSVGISLTVYMVLHLIASFTISAFTGAMYNIFSLLFKVVRFGVPVLVYSKLTGYVPIKKEPLPKLSGKAVAEFIFALSFVVTAVNTVGTATEKFFSLVGIKTASGRLPQGSGEFIFMFFGSVLLAAVTEELLFRGVVMDALDGFSEKTKILSSAFLFALVHCNMLQIPYSFVAGAVISAFFVKTGSILYAVAIHFTANAVTYVFTLVRVLVPEKTALLVSDIAFWVFAGLSSIGAVYFVIKREKREAFAPKFTFKQFLTAGTAIYVSFALILSLLSIA